MFWCKVENQKAFSFLKLMKYRYAENSNNNKNLEKKLLPSVFAVLVLWFSFWDFGMQELIRVSHCVWNRKLFLFHCFQGSENKIMFSFQSCLDLYQKPLFTRIDLENQGQIQTWLFLLNCTNYSQYFMNLVVTISGGSVHKFPN